MTNYSFIGEWSSLQLCYFIFMSAKYLVTMNAHKIYTCMRLNTIMKNGQKLWVWEYFQVLSRFIYGVHLLFIYISTP